MDLRGVFQDTLSNTCRSQSHRYAGRLIDYQPAKRFADTTLHVKNIDCLEECALHADADADAGPGLLNMASDICAGGGVRKGSRAQEEEICRRTSLYKSLAPNRYPLPALELIYSPDIVIVKDRTYHPTRPVPIRVMSMGAIRRPAVTNGRYAHSGDRALMTEKIRMVLETASYHAVDTLVLGAWGCGAFRNPPAEVAYIFREALYGEYRGVFKHITFAILETGDDLNRAFRDCLL